MSGGLPDNLRHLQLFLALSGKGSLSAAAAQTGLSQPAASQALAALERRAGGPLFARRMGGALTPRGLVLQPRVVRAFAILDQGFVDLSPRLWLTTSHAQLRALIATVDSGSFALAAARLGLKPPSVQRAIATLEAEAGRTLFTRTAQGMRASRAAHSLSRAARLALAELAQAEADLAAIDGVAAGPIRVGALPLARAAWLPAALAAFRRRCPGHAVSIIDGDYGALIGALQRAEIDLVLGALRAPAPHDNICEARVFDDRLALVAAPGHPALGDHPPDLAALARADWVVPRSGAPGRAQFNALFRAARLSPPSDVVETGSVVILRELAVEAGYLGCISGAQLAPELRRGQLVRLPIGSDLPARPIGISTRVGWVPTRVQAMLVDCLHDAAPDVRAQP